MPQSLGFIWNGNKKSDMELQAFLMLKQVFHTLLSIVFNTTPGSLRESNNSLFVVDSLLKVGLVKV